MRTGKFLFWMAAVRCLPRTRCYALKRKLMRLAGVRVADGVRIHSQARFEDPNVVIGANTWVARGTWIIASPRAGIVIGANCDIAPECLLVVNGHNIGPHRRRAGEARILPIHVGDGVWIGARVVVIGGVRIGAGAVVAAGAVVTQDVQPDTMVGGVPARAIKALDGEPVRPT